ncbi:Protein CBG21210 [Caenorhabditis briggsae]|uniref:Coatomer subunit epsilon n=1 Tax=Caenorhabditis briggsae TaxID=6238 RepID=A8XZL2_CAEBR|nr:Protein CBG21210 [Caenorhabditis briggsae]CAP38011.2 Protein CBG21210 [Caenorhabditis briggsae]
MADKLFAIRNYFFLGSYQSCIGEALKFQTKSEEEKQEKDVYLYRAYIAQGQAFIPLKEIPATTKSADLAAVRKFAEFRNNPAAQKKILAEIKEEVASKSLKSEIAGVLAAAILNEADVRDLSLEKRENSKKFKFSSRKIEKNRKNSFPQIFEFGKLFKDIFTSSQTEDAFRAVSRFDGLEARASKVFTLIKMNKRKLAIQEVKKMNQIDEDATLSQLANALVASFGASGKVKDALYIYSEMADKYGRTTDLEMHQAIVSVLTQDYAAAEELLESSLERDNKDADVLINSLVAAQLNEKDDEITERYLSQLKHEHPSHPWVVDFTRKEDEFDSIAF